MNLPPGQWTPLAVDASARRYWRGTLDGAPVLLAHFGEDEDGLRRFLFVRELFARHGVDVPAIVAAPPGQPYVLQELVRGRPLSKSRWPRDLTGRLLGTVARIGTITDWGEGPELLELDEARLRFELAFFRLHFLEGLLNAAVPPGLDRALDALAAEAASFPRALAHRDFHSENLLCTEGGRVVVVDFQDALVAPRCYDAASLAVDPYRRRDDRIAAAIESEWAARCGAEPAEFRRTALQRALKALGTFGYQVIRRKRARYVQFVRPQAETALSLLGAAPVPLEPLEPLLRTALSVA